MLYLSVITTGIVVAIITGLITNVVNGRRMKVIEYQWYTHGFSARANLVAQRIDELDESEETKQELLNLLLQ